MGLYTKFMEVTENQVADFMPTDKYHAIQDVAIWHKLAHCKLTNLFGEGCFGDLDFSLFKRRNASAHHLSTLNMLNRNKTISSFLASLSEAEEQSVFKVSASLASSFRKKHRQQERDAIERKRRDLEEKKAKREAVLQRKRHHKEAILERIRNHGGPCRNEAAVDRLLQHYRKKTPKVLAVKAELQYHKLILEQKSQLLKTTLKLDQLVSNLKLFLKGSHSVPDEPVADVPGEAVADVQITAQDFNFAFTKTGMTAGVMYDDDFYLGEVTAVKSDSLGTINFMERSVIRDDTYRWPAIVDETDVNMKHVFVSDFAMQTTNGRVWTLSNPEAVRERLDCFWNLFC